jgi:hypothetical protein
MSRPSKRFVLPYEPEYTAHRTDGRVGRAGQLHRLARRLVAGPTLVPEHVVDGKVALKGPSPGNPSRAVELERSVSFPRRR